VDEVVNDPTLGRLTWDASQQFWRAEVELQPGRRVILTVDPSGKPQDQAFLRAGQGLAWLREQEQQARLDIADVYLDVYNQNWSEEGPISRAEFVRRLELVEVGFGPEGAPSLWYDDGDMFAGHGILALFDVDGRFQAASLFG
jgi:hypothetical protein